MVLCSWGLDGARWFSSCLQTAASASPLLDMQILMSTLPAKSETLGCSPAVCVVQALPGLLVVIKSEPLMKRKKKRVLDWALLWDLDPWFLILAVHNPDLPKQFDKHLHAQATHPFFLLPKVWWVAREYMTLKTPAACRSSGWTGQGQPLNMNGGLWPPGSLHTELIHSHLPNPSLSQTPCKWHHCWSPAVYQAFYMLVFLQPGKVDLLLFYTRESLTGGSVRTPKPGLPTTMPRSIFADLSRGGGGYARLWGLWETSVSSSVACFVKLGIYL